MLPLSALPTLNAILNGLATLCLVGGWLTIRGGTHTPRRIFIHRCWMTSALVLSAAFLTSYLIYHTRSEAMTPFLGRGGVRYFYYGMLASHIVLASLVPFLALFTFYLGWRGRYRRHRKLARVTFPIWLYVSITGVLIYLMLYQLTP